LKKTIALCIVMVLMFSMTFSGGFSQSFVSQYATDDVMNFTFAGLPRALQNDLKNEFNYTAEDIPIVVRLEVSWVTQLASMVIDVANAVNDGASLGIGYLESGLSGAMEELVSEAAEYAISEGGGEAGEYAISMYTLSEDIDQLIEVADAAGDLAEFTNKSQTLGLSLAQKVLATEMEYINANMPKGLANINSLDTADASRILIYAVHVDAYHEESQLRESGVRFYNYKRENGVDSFVNYYNNIVYSKVEVIPDVSQDEYEYLRAGEAVMEAEWTTEKMDILVAHVMVENLPYGYRKFALQERITLLQKALTEVTFPDSNLEAVIRESIGRYSGAIYESDLKAIETINGASRGISNLSGLEHLTNLATLNMGRNSISNLEPLRNLQKLSYISIHNNSISSLDPIRGLNNLKTLVVWNNQISDLSPISSLYGLINLDASRNRISDITAVRELTNLQTLSIANNRISSIEAVRNLVNLVHFYIGGNSIIDTSPTNEYYHKILRKDF